MKQTATCYYSQKEKRDELQYFLLNVRSNAWLNNIHGIIMAATRSKTSSESKRGSLEEDDVQMPLKLVKESLKPQESTLKVFLSAYMDSINTRIDNLLKDVQC